VCCDKQTHHHIAHSAQTQLGIHPSLADKSFQQSIDAHLKIAILLALGTIDDALDCSEYKDMRECRSKINVRMPNKMVRLLFSNAPDKIGDRAVNNISSSESAFWAFIIISVITAAIFLNLL
jgi:hypothetical protein